MVSRFSSELTIFLAGERGDALLAEATAFGEVIIKGYFACGIHLCKKDIDRKARVYQANALLRRLGVKLHPPGLGSDGLKKNAIGMLDKRKPKNKYELIRSGAVRARYPFTLINKLRGK